MTTTFYVAACLGEFTIPTLKAFDPAIHVKPSDIHIDYDHNSLKSTVFHLPRTKAALNGKDVAWSAQHSVTDPEAALSNHININKPVQDGALFAYCCQNKLCALTKAKLIETVNKAAKIAGLEQ